VPRVPRGRKRSPTPLSHFAPRRDLGSLYAKHFADPCQERRFLSTVGFFGAFTTVRVITHSIRDGKGPFRNITPGGRHVHHMTFGIIGMIITGTLWINEVGTGAQTSRRASRVTSTIFGMGVALTLDEFALWLNLQDDYWTKQGRESIDAVAVYGSLAVLALNSRSLLGDLAHIVRLSPRARRRERLRRLVRNEPRKLVALAADPQGLRALLT
jgi:hypothetical protein